MTNQQTEDIEAKFEKRMSVLDKTLRAAKVHFYLAEKIESFPVDHLAEWNVAPAFWSYTIRAHLHAGILAIAKLLDNRRGSLSLPHFLQFVDSNPQLFSRESLVRRLKKKRPHDSVMDIERWLQDYQGVPDHKAQIEKVENVEKKLPNLSNWRDKVVAHIDKAFINKGQPVGQLYRLPKSEVNSAIDTLEEVLQCYYHAYDMTDRDFSMAFVGNGLERVIEALGKWRSAKVWLEAIPKGICSPRNSLRGINAPE